MVDEKLVEKGRELFGKGGSEGGVYDSLLEGGMKESDAKRTTEQLKAAQQVKDAEEEKAKNLTGQDTNTTTPNQKKSSWWPYILVFIIIAAILAYLVYTGTIKF
ncbi:hypothetical protein CMO83_00740 [Candidatus Woesearchaeota archaeon]|jgi:hypothetical protein|nr:hypothetical protein [Candidatus Woesearchaeota archaeon]|tara:strand:- start:37352 stop:37663 length:312 start_codon:yes stop_codon:yes gene_type:complete